MSNLQDHLAEQAAITALCEAGECNHPECRKTEWHTPMEIDGTDNSTRAARVLQAIYPAYDDDTAETAVRDVLTDLRHLCDLMGWSFATLDQEAHRGYRIELADASGPARNPGLQAAIERELQ